jgi:endonuclease YncB( thermonuclease family)
MIDDTTTHDPSTDPRRNWTQMRERMRETIHAELDRINPTDDARRALELIIESSLRPSEVDGALKLTVIDQDGKPRTIEKDGQQREFTLQDLLEELRVRYGVLFRSAKSDAIDRGQAEQRSQKPEKPQRDWLKLNDEAQKPEVEAPPLRAEPSPLQNPPLRKPRIHDWSRNPLGSLRASLAPKLGAKSEPGDQAAPVAAEHERTAFGGMRTRSWARPGVALGAVAVLALLGVGALLFRGEEPAAHQVAAAEPVAASDETASTEMANPLQDPEPSTTGSTASSASLRGVPDVIDTATLSLKGEVVRLFGVEWAPGGGKPEDLTRYLNGREVACEAAGSNDVYRCQVGNQDLSRVVLFNGGGRPTNDATPDLQAAADKAREAKIGVWGKQQP